MGIYETSQLYLGLAAIIAALLIVRYNRNKSAELEAEQRGALKPLYVIAVGIMFYGLGALATFVENFLGTYVLFDTYMAYYACAIVEVVLMGIAASMILNAKRAYAIPISSLILSAVLFGSAFVFEQTMEFMFLVGFVLPSYVLLFVGGLFAWIAKGTHRAISAALAFALLSQICGLPVLHFGYYDTALTTILLFLALMGPAMVSFAFLRPDQKISIELAGYGASLAGPSLILSAVQAASFAIDPFTLAVAGMGAIAVLLSLGTGTYLYGRWDESRQIPTFLFMVTFLLLGIAQMVGMLGNLEITPSIESFYVEFILTGYGLALLSAGAIYAAGWKGVGLLPLMLFVPISILFIQAYPMDVATAFLNLLHITIPMIAIMLLPAFVFSAVFLRMRARGAPGRLKPLGIALGIILFFAIRLPPLIAEIGGLDWGYGFVFLSYLVSWSAMTGRLDRLVGTG